jgi:hypothetical protein
VRWGFVVSGFSLFRRDMENALMIWDYSTHLSATKCVKSLLILKVYGHFAMILC